MKKVLIGVTIVVLLASAVVYAMGYARPTAAQGKETPEPKMPAVKAPDEVIAEAAVVPAQSATLSVAAGGIVAQVLVAEGDRVAAGQLLVKLGAAHTLSAIAEAEANLKTAEAQLARAQVGPLQEDIAAAEAAVDVAESGVQAAEGAVATARANLARAQAGPSAESIAIAQALLQQVRVGPTAESIAIAERRIEAAKNALWGAQARRDGVCGAKGRGATGADCDSSKAAVQAAEEEVRIAELQLRQAKAGPSREDIAVAQAQLQQAKAGPTREDIAVAEAQLQQALGQLATAQAQVKQAEASLARAKKGVLAEDVAVVRSQVEQARVAVERAKAAMDDYELRAPFAAVVVAMKAKVSEYVAPGQAAVQLADLGAWEIETTDLTELNVVKVKEGASAVITLDAIPDLQLPGKVSRIKALGENNRGDITYKVTITPDTLDARLRWNMTAKVNIKPS